MSYQPLAEQMRPNSLEEVVGQDALLEAHKGILWTHINNESIMSMILWGPPGTGKTSIARLVGQCVPTYNFESISAVSSGTREVKAICNNASSLLAQGIRSILFIDEIHRFNKSQQDALLQYVEDGTIILIGATTENPSFEINNALLSRVRVYVLQSLTLDSLQKIWDLAEQKLKHTFSIDASVLNIIFNQVHGDARILLNIMEQLHSLQKNGTAHITREVLQSLQLSIAPHYDKSDDQHYGFISALHKSIRGSDCDAALYWFARMLDGGEDPRYIGRRMIRMAYEDIGLADIHAPQYVIHALESYERLGSPEGELSLACAIIYLALSPKSNGAYKAYNQVRATSKKHVKNPPKHILNAPTTLMRDMGYSQGYVYDHDTEHGFSGQNYFPENMEREQYYKPVNRGFEREMKKRLEYFF